MAPNSAVNGLNTTTSIAHHQYHHHQLHSFFLFLFFIFISFFEKKYKEALPTVAVARHGFSFESDTSNKGHDAT